MNEVQQWIGRTREQIETITAYPANALAATLDRDDPTYVDESPIPALWHWLYFLSIYKLSEMGRDGHEALGGFLPPLPLPRRMWAGSRLKFLRPVRIGHTIQKQSTIKSITPKKGKCGDLVFVTVCHRLSESSQLLIEEEHDIVYREDPIKGQTPSNGQMVTNESLFRREITPNPVLLFRYSALTFNSHRIHYDANYCRAVEGLEDLVVHGPLQATLMLDLLRREHPESIISEFHFKSINTVFVNHPFSIHAHPSEKFEGYDLWVRRHDGVLAMSGAAHLKKMTFIGTEHD